jgi:hypothetical protein
MGERESPVLISVIKEKGKRIKLLEKLSLSALSFECFYKNAKKMHFSLNYKFLIRTRPKRAFARNSISKEKNWKASSLSIKNV